MAKPDLRTIAFSIRRMREFGYVDGNFLRAGLLDALVSFPHEQSFIEKLLKRPRFEVSITDGIAGLVGDLRPLTHDNISSILSSMIKKQSEANAIESYLVESGFAEHGFPVRKISHQTHLMMLTSNAYRFAYGKSPSLEIEELYKSFEFGGVYVTFSQSKPNSSLYRSILIISPGVTMTEIVELYKPNKLVNARYGFALPTHDRTIALLADQFPEEVVANIISSHGSEEQSYEASIGLSQSDRQSNDIKILQSSNLNYLHLIFSNDRIIGRSMAGKDSPFISGYRISEIDSEQIHKIGFVDENAKGAISGFERSVIEDIGRGSFKVSDQGFE